VTAFLF